LDIKQKEIGFSFWFPDAGFKPEMNRVLDSFACFIDTRPETGKNLIHQPVQNPINLWFERRHQGTNA
jgi:hypothetical protein